MAVLMLLMMLMPIMIIVIVMIIVVIVVVVSVCINISMQAELAVNVLLPVMSGVLAPTSNHRHGCQVMWPSRANES